jgi:hypothetical protein
MNKHVHYTIIHVCTLKLTGTPLYSYVLRREQLCENLTRLGELQCATTRKSFIASTEHGCLEGDVAFGRMDALVEAKTGLYRVFMATRN